MPKFTDNETYDRLSAALRALGDEEAETVRSTTALKMARRVLHVLMYALVYAMETNSDTLKGINSDPPE